MAEDAEQWPSFRITIDLEEFRIVAPRITGEDLRELPTPQIPPEADLWLEIPGPDPDKPIALDETVELRNGMHFFTVRSSN